VDDGLCLLSPLGNRPFFRDEQTSVTVGEIDNVPDLTASQVDIVDLFSVFLQQANLHAEFMKSNPRAQRGRSFSGPSFAPPRSAPSHIFFIPGRGS
jgi:hypothetical protein